MKEFFKKVLFTELPTNPDRKMPVVNNDTNIYILLKKHKNISKSDFFNILTTTVANQINNMQNELGFVSFKEFHEIGHNGKIMASYAMTRSYGYGKFLCNLYGTDLNEPKFKQSYSAAYDCLIELRFSSKITKNQAELIKKYANVTLVKYCKKISYVESNVWYKIYDDEKKADNQVYLTCITRKPAHQTRQETQEYWRTSHAALCVSNVKYARFNNYCQIHAADSSAIHFGIDEYEGVAHIDSQMFQLI